MSQDKKYEQVMAFLKAMPVEEAQQTPGIAIPFSCPNCGNQCVVCCARGNLHIHASCEPCDIHVCE